jgi:hypothetical protein
MKWPITALRLSFLSLLWLHSVSCAPARFTVVSIDQMDVPMPTVSVLDGAVVDDGGQPIIGAVVTIRLAPEKRAIKGFTDLQGRFVLSNVPLGHYMLSVECPGYYLLKVKDIQLSPGFTVHARCVMSGLSMRDSECLIVDGPAMINTKSTESGIIVFEDYMGRTNIWNK